MQNHHLAYFLLISTLTTTIQSSPFDLTDQYVNNFKQEIQQLENLAETYVPPAVPEIKTAQIEEDTAEKYDFIIVGAGAAGAVLAARLSEVPEWKILVLEAGGDETEATKVPKLAPLTWNTPNNWKYVTTPQEHSCLGMVNHSCALDMGKILGGGTSINSLLYTRGNAKDYDLWADLDKENKGWCYDDVLPYFKKAEDAQLDNFDPKYHNHGGPLHIQMPQHLAQSTPLLIQAGKELGLSNVDYNGKTQFGISIAQINTKQGKRDSTNQAYLQQAKQRPNLTIKTKAHVTKILIGEHTKQAQGVLYLHDGKLHSVKAEKDVILASGAINTPQLLMLSGIGDEEHLKSLEIPLVKHLPAVGQNLKDHFGFFGLDFVYNDTQSEENTKISEDDAIVEYLKNGKGPLTSNNLEVLAYIQTKEQKLENYPDIELYFFEKKVGSTKKTPNLFRINKEIQEKLWAPLKDKTTLQIGTVLLHPKSSGSIKLHSNNPLVPPLINTNQFSDAEHHDLKTMVEGIKYAVKFSQTETFKGKLHPNTVPIPGCETMEWGTDAYWQCAVKHLSTSFRHVSGTAKMGRNEADSVVDARLKVHGVEKLRIADTSIIPVTISGHLMAPAVMIGEKAADLIKTDWK